MLLDCRPKTFCISIVFSFSWELKWPPRETENNAYAKFWGDKQRTLWCVMVFLEWSIRDLIFFVGVCAKDRVFSDKLVSPDGSTILMEMLKVSLISIEFSRYM